jgi:hypothetical protein
MLFHMHRKEGVLTILGTLALIGLSLTDLPRVATSVPEVLTQTAVLLSLEILTTCMLLVGLSMGFRRHRDVSPLLFTLLGFGTLMLNTFGNLPLFLPLLCALAFLVAGIWNAVLRSQKKNVRTTMPTFDAFLDNTLLPEDNDETS